LAAQATIKVQPQSGCQDIWDNLHRRAGAASALRQQRESGVDFETADLLKYPALKLAKI
jgi:hypothetical protein